MIDNPFRELLARHAGPLVRLYGALGLTPNAVSVLGFVLALLAASCVVAEQPIAALGLWWLGRLADGTDGIYARATGLSSGFGAYFDVVLDRKSVV